MRFDTQQSFHIGEPSEISAARRAVGLLAAKLAFGATKRGQAELIVTEAATNILKHAVRGEILIRSVVQGDCIGIEIIAIDKGPGICDIKSQMEDGNSSTGTYGGGLGAMSRLAQEFNIYSTYNHGAVLAMVIWAAKIPIADLHWQIGAICTPLKSEVMCGDAWMAISDGNIFTMLVADGLGHGPEAAKASTAAVEIVSEHFTKPPRVTMELAHAALRGTRGAAVAICQINDDRGELRFAGVGNIAMSIFTSTERRHLLSHNGIVGSNLRKVQEFVQPWEQGSMLIAHSDGLATRWDIAAYPGLAHSHPSLIAAILYRDFARGRDDVVAVVVKNISGC
jgi:anti-sigma regulatory factor (Ser/Thr protein kinase)